MRDEEYEVPRPLSRRGWLKTTLRGGALAALGVVGWKLFRRRDEGGPLHGPCTADGICRRCPSSPECPLPQAMSYRAAGTQADDAGGER